VKPGDLVQKKFHEDGRIYPYWGSKSTGIPDPIDYMIDGECGIVVESLEPQVWKRGSDPHNHRENRVDQLLFSLPGAKLRGRVID